MCFFCEKNPVFLGNAHVCCCCASYFIDVHACFSWQVQSCIQRCDLKCIQVSSVGWAHIAVLLCHSLSALLVCISHRLVFPDAFYPCSSHFTLHKESLITQGGCKEDRAKLLIWCPITRQEGRGKTEAQKQFGSLWILGNFFSMVRVAKQWNRLPRETVQSPHLEMPKAQLDKSGTTSSRKLCFEQRDWARPCPHVASSLSCSMFLISIPFS